MSIPDHQGLSLIERKECWLCGVAGETLYDALEDMLFDAPGSWRFRRCTASDCGLVWLDPCLGEADIDRAYRSYYTHDGDAHPPVPFFFFRLFHAWQRFTELARERRRLSLMTLDELPPGRLLDIGSGDGRFLHEMERRGWSASGIELDRTAVRLARERYGVSVRHGSPRDFSFEDDSFDAITMSHVIEHVHDPVALLRACRDALTPTGRLVVVTPNLESLGHRRFGRHWRGLEPPRHLSLFSRRTLGRVADSAGLRTSRLWTSSRTASYVYLTSTLLERGQPLRPRLYGESFARIASASWFSWRELSANRREPGFGEELVLEATR